jgi:hypothetical protein
LKELNQRRSFERQEEHITPLIMTVFQQLKKEEYDLIEKLNPSELKMTEDQQKEFEKKFKIVGDAEDKVTSEKSFIE